MVKVKRTSADYPVFAFRVEQAIKDELARDLEVVRDRLNKKKKRARYWLKNDVFVEALREGIKALKKK
jgi:hypothetical protein